MGMHYHGVHWNRQKMVYDLVLAGAMVFGLAGFAVVSLLTNPFLTVETLLLRGTAFLCLLLVQVILCLGPLARLSTRFLPLLYNRRHLGVCLFLLASAHGLIALIQHHALGNRFPLVSVFTAYGQEFGQALRQLPALAHLPFEPFGVAALAILFLMAATSHDFWLRLLGASLWKSLHLLVYFAYGLILVHVALGFLQAETGAIYTIFVFAGALVVFGVHLASFARGRAEARAQGRRMAECGFLPACAIGDLAEDQGLAIRVGKRRIALFLHENQVFALNGVCRHQGGPIGEGRIVDGCVTCPWHGWQYKPDDGCSPPPFDEHIATYPVEIRDGKVYVRPERNPKGATGTGAALPVPRHAEETEPPSPFYIGYQQIVPEPLRPFLSSAATVFLVAVPVLAAAFGYFQSTQPPGHFEFGQTTTLSGTLYTTPVPSLFVSPEGAASGYHVLLCGTGKFGIPEGWSAYDETPVSLSGTLIYQDGNTMLEIPRDRDPELAPPDTPVARRPDTEILGTVALVGELVDTKCYFGVMRPATGKVHRACAIRCLSGGVPPGLLVRGERESAVVMLAGSARESLEYDVSWAGRKVLARGVLERQNGFSLLRVGEMSLYDAREEPRTQATGSEAG